MTRVEAQALGAHCDLCPLAKKEGNGPVPPRPASSGVTRLVVVSDSPGRRDVDLKKQLAGMGGKFLFVELAKVGVKESECYVTSAALCRGEGDKEDERAAECCAPRLLQELRARVTGAGSSPVPLLLLGKTPCRTVLAVRKAGHARGFVWRIPQTQVTKAPVPPKEGSKRKARVEGAQARLKRETGEARNSLQGGVWPAPVLPSLALSFILKADAWAGVFRRDLARVARLCEGTTAADEEGGKPDAIGGLEVLRGLGPEVSCDIETDGINPRECAILCVGFTCVKTGRTAVVWPFKGVDVKKLGKWCGARERVVFHNGFNFDLLCLRNQGVVW